eukprot:TRINITY_DN8121_c0_g2_i1.p1 TRINITY_DN8121_c0_g2~~TRINITY_DN8121_c0_g2_i1.p1  ORF type:complete len:227 (-),score=11.09 TRINITY_DN8121_c0_g2_i1:2-682(-)
MRAFAILCIALLVSQSITQNYAYYSQCDPNWADDTLGSQTICAIGCLVSSVAMALTTYKRSCDANPCTPKALNQWLKNNGGYSGNLFVWHSVAKLGFTFEGWDNKAENAKAAFRTGKIAILNVNAGRHWVLAVGVVPSGFKVHDPGYNKQVYTDGEIIDAGIFKKSFLTVSDLLSMQSTSATSQQSSVYVGVYLSSAFSKVLCPWVQACSSSTLRPQEYDLSLIHI